jgi:TPR repeat protein
MGRGFPRSLPAVGLLLLVTAVSGIALGIGPGIAWAASPAPAPAPAPSSAEDGQRAYDAGQFEQARRVWSGLAQAGDPQAAFGMGLLCDLGSGMPADARAAFDWYRRAAEAGLPEAAFNVAVMKDAGRGTAHDIDGAALWYARAAAAGYARAAFNLGELYEDGEGVPRNPQLAAAWFHQAAAGGLTAAATKAAVLEKATPRPDAANPPAAVRPEAPSGVVPVGAADHPRPVVLVWTAPSQTQPVSFFVEIERLTPDAPQQVYAQFVAVSAVAVSLVPGRYAWRVTSVGRAGAAYTPGAWTQFQAIAAKAERQAAE